MKQKNIRISIIDISDKFKKRINSITNKPIIEFCQEAIEQTVQVMEDDLRLLCA